MDGDTEPPSKVRKFSTHPFQMVKNPTVLNEVKDKKVVFLHAKVEPNCEDAGIILLLRF